jgi:UDP-glucose 4-epimerase
MKRIGVIGGLGVIGPWLIRRLLAEGTEVFTIDVRDDVSLLPDVADRFTRCTADVRDVDALTAVLADRGPINALANLAVADAGASDPYLSFSVNGHGSVTVLEAARRTGVPRVIYASSKAAYGRILAPYGHPEFEPLPEDHPLSVHPDLPVYSASKRYGEDAGVLYAERFGLEFAAMRFATIVGPGKQARHGPTSIQSRMIENAVAGVGTVGEAGGDQRDDMVYVKDVAAGLASALLTKQLGHQAYNLGSGRLSTLRDLAAAIRENIADVEIDIGPGLNYLVGLRDAYALMDMSRAQSDLGYEPAYDLPAAVSDYAKELIALGVAVAANEAQSAWGS